LQGFEDIYHRDYLSGSDFILSDVKKAKNIKDIDPLLLKKLLIVEMEVIFSIYLVEIAARF